MPGNFGNNFMKAMIKSPFAPLLGKGMAVITLKGCKTGKEISTPINVLRERDVFTVISSRERTWWRNLRNGAAAYLHTEGKDFQVQGEVFEVDDAVKVQLSAFLHQQPVVAKYLKIRSGAENIFNEEDISQAAHERVLIKLHIIQ